MQPWAGNDRPALQPHPACRSARAGQPHLPPHCGAPGWHGAVRVRASRWLGALGPPLAVNGFVALPAPGGQLWLLPSSSSPHSLQHPSTSSLAEVPGSLYSTSLSALFSRGGAERFLPGDTGWWAWCSPHCGLYGSPRRTKGVLAARLSLFLSRQ